MQFLTPLGFLLAALAVPILLLYMLRLRRKQVQVSSTFLWVQLLREQQANAPWQKLKRNLLLILQLLILAALVIAYARPAVQIPTVASGSVIVLLDGSASMNAVDVEPSRFEEARRSVQALIDGLSSASSMTLILVADSPQTLISAETDKTLLRQALDNANVTHGPADWQSAFALAGGAARGNQGNATIVVVSDGGLPQDALAAVPADVRYIPVGNSDDNLTISALALRPAEEGPQLFIEVSNYSDASRSVLLSIYSNDDLLDARQLQLQAGASENFTLDGLSKSTSIYTAQLSSPDGSDDLDSLALDDTAFAVYESAASRRVLLVSNGNLFLEQLLASLPGLQPFRALPAEDGSLQLPNDPFDLYIFDGQIPSELPQANLLLINPSTNPFFDVGAVHNEFKNVRVNDGPLTRFVDWSGVHILEAKTVQTPPWADTLIESDAGPLVFAGETDGQRIAAVTFDLRQSDLPLQVAYPILFSNLIDYVAPPGAFDSLRSLRPGEALSLLRPPDAERIVIASPSDQAYSLAPEQTTFTQTHELGFYAVNFVSQDSTRVQYFAVNLFDEQESNIRPREMIQVGQETVTPSASGQVGQRELWKWPIALALLVLMIEWQVYHRKALPVRLPART